MKGEAAQADVWMSALSYHQLFCLDKKPIFLVK